MFSLLHGKIEAKVAFMPINIFSHTILNVVILYLHMIISFQQLSFILDMLMICTNITAFLVLIMHGNVF